MLDPASEAANAAKAANEVGISSNLHYIFTLFMFLISCGSLVIGWVVGRKKEVPDQPHQDLSSALRDHDQARAIDALVHGMDKANASLSDLVRLLYQMDQGQRETHRLLEAYLNDANMTPNRVGMHRRNHDGDNGEKT
jgi:hypothetical protein